MGYSTKEDIRIQVSCSEFVPQYFPVAALSAFVIASSQLLRFSLGTGALPQKEAKAILLWFPQNPLATELQHNFHFPFIPRLLPCAQ